MATDPSQLIQSLLGGGAAIGQSFAQGQQNQADLANAQQENQIRAWQFQQQQDAAAQQSQDQQAYENDVNGWINGGSTAQGLSDLIAKHPDQYKALQAGWNAKSDAQTKADLGFWGGVHGFLEKGDAQGAAALANKRLVADKAAGRDTSTDQAFVDSIGAGDSDAIAHAKAFALGQVAAGTGPDKFADTYGTVNKDDENFTLTPGSRRFDATGKQIAAAPSGVHYEKVQTVDADGNPVTQLVAVGGEGGDPVSTGGGAADGSTQPRRVGGWTPSTVDGGNNVPAVVTAKVATLSHALGIDPHAQLTPAQRVQLAQAIAPTEGGPGSIADKNNNPTNIMDGAFARSQPGYAGKGAGGYAKFNTRDAGFAAANALLGHYAARGQNTIDDIIRGKQVGVPNSASVPAGMPAGARVLYSVKSAPKGSDMSSDSDARLDDATVQTMAQQYLAGDPTVLTNLGRGRQGAGNIVRVRQAIAQQAKAANMTGAQIAAQMIQFKGDAAAMRTAGTRSANADIAVNEFQNLVPLALKASDSVPRSNFLPFSKAEQVYNQNTNDPKYKQFVAANNSLVNVYARAISPTGQPALADKEHAREILDTATSPSAYRAVVGQLMQEAHAAQQSPGQVRSQIYNQVGSRGGAPSGQPTHISASGKFAFYPGKGWIAR